MKLSVRTKIEKLITAKIESTNLIVLALILCYTVTFSCLTMIRHHAYRTCAFDLGIFSQTLWSTIHGRFFYETPDLPLSESFFGVHFSPILFLVLPFYALLPYPEILLIFQSFIVALGALPLYWLAQEELKNCNHALIVVILYLLYPPLHASNFYDFHVQSFLPLFFIFGFYYLLKEEWVKGILFVILAMLTIEIATLFTLTMGLYFLIKGLTHLKDRKRLNTVLIPIFIMLLSITTFLVELNVISSFNKKPPFIEGTVEWFPHLGKTLSEILCNVFSYHVFEAIFHDWPLKLLYWTMLLAPLLWLPILSPLELATLLIPYLATSLLTTYPAFYQIGWQYNFFVTHSLFIALIYSLKKFLIHRKIILNMLIKSIVVCLILLSPVSPIPFTLLYLPGAAYLPYKITEHEKLLNEIVLLIPQNASILTQNDIFPHVCNRFDAYIYLTNDDVKPEYILVDFIKSKELGTRIWNFTTEEVFLRLVDTHEYGTLVMADGIWLLKLNYQDEPILLKPFINPLRLTYRDLILSSGGYWWDLFAESKVVLIRREYNSPDATFWFSPYITLPPGDYVVNFKLKTSKVVDEKVITIDVVTDYGNTVLADKDIYGYEFKAGTWTDFELRFSLTKVTPLIEFRGVRASNCCSICLDYIEIMQVRAVA